MLGYLRGLLNFFTGGVRDLWNSVVSLVASVYSSLHDDDAAIIGYAQAIASGLWRLGLSYGQFTQNDYPRFVKWVEGWISTLLQREQQDYNQLIADINTLAHRTTQNVTIVQQQEQSDILGLIKWIISAIFDPLRSLISGALSWITNEGAWLFDLLTHLEKLADLIMAFLWDGWFLLFRKYLKQVVVFIFRNWKSWIPAILPVIEDIIVSIFLGEQRERRR